MSIENQIRKPAVAGLFYAGQKNTLEREVAIFLENAKGDIRFESRLEAGTTFYITLPRISG